MIAVDPLADIAERRTQDFFNSSAQTKPEPVFRNALISQMEIWSKNQSDLANEEERKKQEALLKEGELDYEGELGLFTNHFQRLSSQDGTAADHAEIAGKVMVDSPGLEGSWDKLQQGRWGITLDIYGREFDGRQLGSGHHVHTEYIVDQRDETISVERIHVAEDIRQEDWFTLDLKNGVLTNLSQRR